MDEILEHTGYLVFHTIAITHICLSKLFLVEEERARQSWRRPRCQCACGLITDWHVVWLLPFQRRRRRSRQRS